MPDTTRHPDEPDACPGALRPHLAADGALARVRLPGGRLTGDQLRVLADAADHLGDGTLELTSRANIQIRGMAVASVSTLADRLAAAGLLPSATHERVRNIVASPLSGVDGHGLATTLDRALCAVPELSALPGRFLFTVDDGRGDVAGMGADVGLWPLDGHMAAVTVGGRDHGVRCSLMDAVPTMINAARQFLTEPEIRDGVAWRVAELADHGAALAARLTDDLAEPVEVPAPLARGPIGPVGSAVVAGAPLGRLTTAQAHTIADVADMIIITPWRSVVLPRRIDADLLWDADSPLSGVTACTGKPKCAKALTDVRAHARATPSGRLPVHWAGCERRCGVPRGRVVDVVSTVDGYQVWVNGRQCGTALSAQQAAQLAGEARRTV
ncbi:precorrin-3B synthase [Herbihabitans rhizosphaerae]|uniref:precorrin-3B synthase n=1 Tax=Herbihabitans rhizosphaerae TaxID=1872711 RepID=UPI00102ABFC8|nr:precorrin-3B synthase [Herbihabitans rhizosphaerae]